MTLHPTATDPSLPALQMGAAASLMPSRLRFSEPAVPADALTHLVIFDVSPATPIRTAMRLVPDPTGSAILKRLRSSGWHEEASSSPASTCLPSRRLPSSGRSRRCKVEVLMYSSRLFSVPSNPYSPPCGLVPVPTRRSASDRASTYGRVLRREQHPRACRFVDAELAWVITVFWYALSRAARPGQRTSAEVRLVSSSQAVVDAEPDGWVDVQLVDPVWLDPVNVP